ncbi:MAG: hypothetical protein M1281_13705 [Chloroflexi bacterium]|nr:hypothetical protein [Chloroflexota bacterium]MCL4561655.1 hypothetical protein [Chloroflexota bacterium]
MKSEIPIPLDDFWDQILSRQPEIIRLAFAQADQMEQKNVLSHLKRMATEEGWHPQQRASAIAALDALESN